MFLRHPVKDSAFSAGHDVSVSPISENNAGAEAAGPYTVRIDVADYAYPFRATAVVNEARLEVVVMDGRGRQITDLTPGDFEVFQDGVRQKVTSSVYINHLPGESAALREDDLRRNIVFAVDTFNMGGISDLYYAKLGLGRFVERQMLPGDMVSIRQTGYSNTPRFEPINPAPINLKPMPHIVYPRA